MHFFHFSFHLKYYQHIGSGNHGTWKSNFLFGTEEVISGLREVVVTFWDEFQNILIPSQNNVNEVKLRTVFELGGHLMDEILKYYLMRIHNNWVTFLLDPYFLPLIILTNRYRVCDPLPPTAVRVKGAGLPIYTPFICWNLKLAHFYECMYIGNNATKWHFVFCHCITVFFWWILYSTICSDDTLYIKS